MSKIGVFYGPELGSVEKVARVIEKKLGADKVELIAAKKADETALAQYDKLIFGMSTIGKTNWDSEHKDTDWDEFATRFGKLNWAGKKVAMYCLGDHIQYPQHFRYRYLSRCSRTCSLIRPRSYSSHIVTCTLLAIRALLGYWKEQDTCHKCFDIPCDIER